jgi:hypothetical protein
MDTKEKVMCVVANRVADILRSRDIAFAKLNDDMLIIVKGQSLKKFEKQMRKCMEHRVSASVAFRNSDAQQLVEREEGFRDIVLADKENIENISGAEELVVMKDFVQDLGKKYPVVNVNGTDVIIGYNGSVKLDTADPGFFDQLDVVMEHLLVHDDLKAFHARP